MYDVIVNLCFIFWDNCRGGLKISSLLGVVSNEYLFF